MSDGTPDTEAAEEAYARAVERIHSVHLRALSRVDLSGLDDLRVIPEELSLIEHLDELYLDGTNIADLSPLREFLNLRDLYCRTCPVGDLTALSGKLGLQKLFADRTQIKSIAPLKALPELSVLSISNTPVADLFPVLEIPKLIDPWGYNDFHYEGCHACALDPELADIASHTDRETRRLLTVSHLELHQQDWPPEPPEVAVEEPQSPTAAQYHVAHGRIDYDPTPPGAISPLVAQIHAALVADTDALLAACPETHNRYGLLGTRLAAYRDRLGAAPEEIAAFPLWIAGNHLRKTLKADAQAEEDPLEGMAKLDPTRAAELEGLVETHNVLASALPELEAFDLRKIDPAERARLEANRAVVSEMITALQGQIGLFVDRVRADLAALDHEAQGAGAKAERAFVLTDESLHNLVRAAVAQAVLQMQDPPPGMVKTFASQMPGAAMGAVASSAGPIAAAYFPEFVVMLQPYLASLATHWEATSPNMAKTIDWIVARAKYGRWAP